ncbi:MAG: Eco57I restriction-modification methylase domain-containing protein, partial [bacterium]
LHGIDIDLRAVQISALRLYLKACDLVGPDFRPRRLNLVASDVTLPAAPPRDLLDRFDHDRDIRDLLVGIWSELREASKLGSLLHPERKVEELVAGRREQGFTLELQDDAAWDRFKLDLLEEIRTEFEKEADADDVGRRLFGQDLAKSIGLVEALTRRYDVVVTNPPYAGSKNLDPPVKSFVEREYKDGKRDLYAAFILRCLEFAHQGGYVGMVTQQSWLFLRSFVKLRERVLTNAAVTTLAHLGAGSFEEISGEVVNVALFTLRKDVPGAGHRITAFRLVGPRSPGEKNRLLREAVADKAPGILSTPKQADLQSIPETPFVYWLRPRFFELLRSRKRLSDIAEVRQGLATADNERFLRCFWEVDRLGVVEDGRPIHGRWFWYAKGGRYQKWAGLEWLVVDWERDGERIRATGSRPRVQNTEFYFRPGLTYTQMGRGSMGTRLMEWSIFDVKGMSIFAPEESLCGTGALVSTRVASYLLRVTTQNLEFHAGYVGNLPLPASPIEQLEGVGGACIELKRILVS